MSIVFARFSLIDVADLDACAGRNDPGLVQQHEIDGELRVLAERIGGQDGLRRLSGSRAVLPPPRPLRTVREPFGSHGSSLSFAPYRTRFLNVETSVMDLPVTVGV